MTFITAIPGIPVFDLARSIAFYRDAIGFELIHEDGGFAILVRDDVEVHLSVLDDESWRGRSGDTPVVSGSESFLAGTGGCRFQVSDVDELHERLQRFGAVHPNGPLGDRPWGIREFGALDPDNNGLTFFERRRPRPSGTVRRAYSPTSRVNTALNRSRTPEAPWEPRTPAGN